MGTRRRATLLGVWVGLVLLAAPTVAAAWEKDLAEGRQAVREFRIDDAETHLRRALQAAEGDTARPWADPMVRYWLADFYVRIPFAPGAEDPEALLRQSESGFVRVFGPDNRALVPVYVRLAAVQVEQERLDEARESIARAEVCAEGMRIHRKFQAGAEILNPEGFFGMAANRYRREAQPGARPPAAD